MIRQYSGPCLLILFAAACTQSPEVAVAVQEPDPDLVFVRGYQHTEDSCQLTGESAFTVDYLDHTADLVTCPTGSEDAAIVAALPGASIVTQTTSYTLYSVSRG